MLFVKLKILDTPAAFSSFPRELKNNKECEKHLLPEVTVVWNDCSLIKIGLCLGTLQVVCVWAGRKVKY
ncbi:hypothetical protein J6590_090816 [Homalodisca vitripennis]|nr:hypothetical protein J6590_090816 [Homalodisca vitripennis]